MRTLHMHAPVTSARDAVRAERPAASETFAAAVAALTSAFGDPTRRDVYLLVRDAESVTATEVAERFALHPNVARHHLDKLAAGGYLEVTLERPPDGKLRAGRPSKRYRLSPKDVVADLPGHRDDLLVRLLARALALLAPSEAEGMAEEVGRSYGSELAERMSPGEGQRSLRVAMQSVADALTAHGFDAHAEARSGGPVVVSGHCPFGDAATAHPVLCAVERGMVAGLLAGLCGEPVRVHMSSRARGDVVCETVV